MEEKILAKLDSMQNQMNKMDEEISGIKKEVKEIKEDVGNLTDQMFAMEEDYGRKINIMFEELMAKNERTEGTERNLMALQRRVDKNSAFIINYENQNTTFQKSNWVLNILQYSDIAIYLEHSGETLTSSNTIKQLSLENLQISAPKIGTPALYYLDSLNFGTATFSQIHKLDNSIEFTVLNDENKNKEIQSNTPVFFTDCSNPITLKYVNQSIKENYTITSHEPVFFDGRLLQMANVPLADLEADIHFDIYLKSNDNIDYFYHLSLPIFLENDDSSIYDGSILVEKSFENYKFLKK